MAWVILLYGLPAGVAKINLEPWLDPRSMPITIYKVKNFHFDFKGVFLSINLEFSHCNDITE